MSLMEELGDHYIYVIGEILPSESFMIQLVHQLSTFLNMAFRGAGRASHVSLASWT